MDKNLFTADFILTYFFFFVSLEREAQELIVIKHQMKLPTRRNQITKIHLVHMSIGK